MRTSRSRPTKCLYTRGPGERLLSPALAFGAVTPQLNAVSAQEVERYRREHLGKQGWDKRRAPGYRPSKMAGWAKDYRARRKARQESGEGPEDE